jgi:hypothetical protein
MIPLTALHSGQTGRFNSLATAGFVTSEDNMVLIGSIFGTLSHPVPLSKESVKKGIWKSSLAAEATAVRLRSKLRLPKYWRQLPHWYIQSECSICTSFGTFEAQ